MVEPSARFEEVRIPLPEPIHGIQEVSGVLGIPEWWPTGARVAVAIAHSAAGDLNDPLIEQLHRQLTEKRFLCLRFNFPFAEAGKRSSSDSPAVLERCFRAALSALGRDPTAAPAQLFIGGMGLGGRVAAHLATSRLRIDGLFFLGFPLHTQDKPDEVHAEHLYRLVSPMLFVQGTRDRQCELTALQRTLGRIGAPTTLHVTQDADPNFRVPKKSSRTDEEVRTEVAGVTTRWIEKVVNEA